MPRDRASRPGERSLRLFIAVDVPGRVREELARRVEPFRESVPVAKWTEINGWHVTLKFLGATWPQQVDQVMEAVTSAAAGRTATTSALTRIGAFPTPRRARVIWAGLADEDGGLAAIVGELDERLEAHFRPETRGLTPHLTLARLRTQANLETTAPELLDLDVATEAFSIRELLLYRSHLSPKGATYEPIHRAPLRPIGRESVGDA